MIKDFEVIPAPVGYRALVGGRLHGEFSWRIVPVPAFVTDTANYRVFDSSSYLTCKPVFLGEFMAFMTIRKWLVITPDGVYYDWDGCIVPDVEQFKIDYEKELKRKKIAEE